MCGITAYLGTKPGFGMVYQGIEQLQNRGYDSCGIASLSECQRAGELAKPGKDKLLIHKYASRPDMPAVTRIGLEASEHAESCNLIAHTRWSTHGRISDQNSHPHVDMSGRLALVHNGIIENYQSLREFLEGEEIKFSSETDTEVIVQLIGYRLGLLGETTENALEWAVEQLEGTWGLVLLDRERPDCLFLSRNGSPLLVGEDQGYVMVASETAGLAHAVKKYFSLKDHQILRIGLVNGNIEYSEQTLETRPISDESRLIKQSPAPYAHWMLKEIMEQEDTVMRVLNHGGRLLGSDKARLGGLESHQNELLGIEDLVILACGTSYHAGLLGSSYLKHLGCFRTVQVFDASEFSLEDLPKSAWRSGEVGVLVLSQSGETKDVHRAMELLDGNFPIFSIVNVVDSLIAQQADCGVYLNAGREVAVASTKSFTSQVIAIMLIGLWFADHHHEAQIIRSKMVEALRSIPIKVRGLLSGLEGLFSEELIGRLAQAERLFVLGRGAGHVIAREAALKIKEVSYLHAESYPGGGLKHGPFALIEDGTPILLISFDDHQAGKMDLAAIETKTRGAWTIGLTSRSGKVGCDYDDLIRIGSGWDSVSEPILMMMVLQYLAYRLALARGLNPDYPRNLAKVVTVDG